MNDPIGLPQLCNELITEICLYLPIADRKNVRLVCKSLYIACQCFPITRTEKFVIRPCYSDAEIQRTLMSCHYDKMNLDFRRIRLNDLQPHLFRSIGDRILYICLFECSLSVESIKNIFNQCYNLQHFELYMRTKRYKEIDQQLVPCQIDAEHDTWLIAAALKGLCEEKMIRQNLIAFEIHSHSVSHAVCNEVAEKAFAMFPNLKTFLCGEILRSLDLPRVKYAMNDGNRSAFDDDFMSALHSYMNDPAIPEFALKHLENPPRYSSECNLRVDQYLRSSKVETFKFRICNHLDWFDKICALENKQFKILHVKMKMYTSDEEMFNRLMLGIDFLTAEETDFLSRVENFLSKQTEIEELSLALEPFSGVTLHDIIKSCPNLRRLTFSGLTVGPHADDDLLAILNSNLEYLHVMKIDVQNPSDSFRMPFNEHLQTLILDRRWDEYDAMSPESHAVILKHFRRLTHLTLKGISDDELQLIFRYHPNLVSLTIAPLDYKGFTSYGFTGQRNSRKNPFGGPTYSIKNMTKLQTLFLDYSKTSEGIGLSKRAISEFDLPQLRRFAVRSCMNLCIVDLATFVICKSPLLEELEASCLFEHHQLFKLLEPAKNLRKMMCFNPIALCSKKIANFKIDEEILRKLFASCKSLRLFSDYNRVVYYNPFTYMIYEIQNLDWLDESGCVKL